MSSCGDCQGVVPPGEICCVTCGQPGPGVPPALAASTVKVLRERKEYDARKARLAAEIQRLGPCPTPRCISHAGHAGLCVTVYDPALDGPK